MAADPLPRLFDETDEHRRIGRYRVQQTLGRGAMGVVYQAEDPLIGRPVAVKTLSPDHPLAGEKAESLRRHLLNEAASAGMLNHPGIVTVHDVIDDGDGRVSIAMELVEGETLKDRLARDEPLSLGRIAAIVGEIAAVLDFVHERGVVHRDVKPANVMLAEDGTVKITDFGIASLRGQDLAHELEAMGTPNYLAPERLLGHEADHRADIYALGVLLYEMLTRQLPFQGETLADLVRNTVQEDPTAPELFRPDLSPGLRKVLDRALAKDPLERYQRAGELAAALSICVERQQSASDTQPITRVIPLLETPTTRRRGWRAVATQIGSKLVGRPRRLAAVAAVIVLAALAGLAVATWRPASSAAEVPPVEMAAPQSEAAYLALLDEVQRLYQEGRDEEAERKIAEADLAQAERIRELRREAWWEAQTDRVALRVVQKIELLRAARGALDRGDLATADAALIKLEELAPEDQEAADLRAELAGNRRRARRAARPAAPVVTAEPAAEPAPQFEPFEIENPPAIATTSPFGRVKIDFESRLPRGVLTIYAGDEQILRRKYEFVERRGLFRRAVPRPGGFDEIHRLPAGELELKVYASGPNRPARLKTLDVDLPGATSRTLKVRLNETGELTATWH